MPALFFCYSMLGGVRVCIPKHLNLKRLGMVFKEVCRTLFTDSLRKYYSNIQKPAGQHTFQQRDLMKQETNNENPTTQDAMKHQNIKS